MSSILSVLFAHYKANIAPAQVTEYITAHHAYPSMESISEGLDELGFQTMAVHIQADRLAQVPLPAVAHLSPDTFVLLTTYINEHFTYTNGQKTTTENITDFQKKWSGNLLLISPTDTLPKKKMEILTKNNVLFLFSVLLGFIFLYQTMQVLPSFLFLWGCKFLGLGVSLALLSMSIHENSYFQKLCKVNKNTNCESVLSSPASQITTWLGWADVGFFYFGGGFLSLFLVSFSQNNAVILPYFWVLSALSLPYSVWSVYYQWRVVRDWCVFCLVVQVIFWVEFFGLWVFGVSDFVFDVRVLLLVMLGFLLPMLGWIWIKEDIKNAQNMNQWKIRALRLQNNPKIFEALLHKQKILSLPPQYDFVLLGNAEANKQITIFTNLYCKPCAVAHQKIISLQETEDICIRLCFLSFEGKESTTQYFLELYKEMSQENFEKILDEWYALKTKNLAEFAQKYPLKNPTANDNLLENHYSIAQINNIYQTPTIFLQGYLLPESYSWSSLLYHIKKI